MTISVSAILFFFLKALFLVAWGVISAVLFLWPANDQPTNKGQWVIWWICLVLAAILTFTNFFKFTA